MNQFGYPESDWKLYKSKIADWQEGYMEKLCKEDIELLSCPRKDFGSLKSVSGTIREIRAWS